MNRMVTAEVKANKYGYWSASTGGQVDEDVHARVFFAAGEIYRNLFANGFAAERFRIDRCYFERHAWRAARAAAVDLGLEQLENFWSALFTPRLRVANRFPVVEQ